MSLVPTLVKIQRRKGVVVRDCDIYIGRCCNQGGWKLDGSKWQNPFTIRMCGSAEKAVEKYREYILNNKGLLEDIPELYGRRLGCWCTPAPCHGDVLIELATKMLMSDNERGVTSKKRKTLQERIAALTSSPTTIEEAEEESGHKIKKRKLSNESSPEE